MDGAENLFLRAGRNNLFPLKRRENRAAPDGPTNQREAFIHGRWKRSARPRSFRRET